MNREEKAPVKRTLLIQDLFVGRDHLKTIPYSGFQSLIDRDGVSEPLIGATRIPGTYKEAAENGGAQHFSRVRVDPQIVSELTRRKFSGEPEPGLLQSLLSWLLPTALFVLLWLFMRRPMMAGNHGGSMGIGKSSAKAGRFPVRATPAWRPRTYGDGTAEAIDREVRQLIEKAFETARSILERNRSTLELSAREQPPLPRPILAATNSDGQGTLSGQVWS